MSQNQIKLAGFEEFKAQLRNLPHHLAEEASTIVSRHAQQAAATVRDAYPQGPTGKLKQGVKIKTLAVSAAATAMQVQSTAKIAFIVENGTQVRHTAEGWNRGVMPPGHFFVPVVVRERRAMFEQLIAMLQREGLTVTGRG